ncbi:hypothetical protein KGY71_07205, partial [Candidatus Bipolaricaulota bacterium]|nr:hypothetical protein [Candidatus Bipolaricaulota bacterium]
MEDIFEVAEIRPSILLDKAEQNILVVDGDGKIVFANETIKENVDDGGENLVGEPLSSNVDFSSNEENGSSFNPVLRSITSGKGSSVTEEV